MQLPVPVQDLIARLRGAGFPAYAVGGCVRDSLLGLTPHDWDLCTAASPEEMKRVFAGERIAETGLRHGTLTVIRDHIPYEITTFRTEGSYSDHRHPDSVSFVTDVREDLARRDFTINAMAWAPEEGLLDLFGGREDLDRGIIRCVGVPEERFEEDALRILRALRFASVYDFALDPDTSRAVRALYSTLDRVAAERLREELLKLLCGKAAGRMLREYPEVFSAMIPDLLLSHLNNCRTTDPKVITPVRIIPKHVRRILLVTIATPSELLRLSIREYNSILHSISSIPL